MNDRWVTGDQYGFAIPGDPEALRRGEARFLTDAFHTAGTLAADAAVTHVTDFREVPGGSTGRKVALSVECDGSGLGRHADLFVKFSRDFEDPLRDRGKTQMEPEVRFAELSRVSEFPIVVPRVLFGDYHAPTGTGILITERICFGDNGIERQYHKCLDYEMPEPVEHYRALFTALGRLAGTHRSGRLPSELTAHFPLDVGAATVGQRAPLTAEKLNRRLAQLADFAKDHPGLLPDNVCKSTFLDSLRNEVPSFAAREDMVMRHLAGESDYIALCHWNANVDNAWFWRDSAGVLRCGLMDWGCVSQLNLGMAVWGAMSGAETELWDQHLNELLQLFVAEVHQCGGPRLDPNLLARHTMLYAAVMGVAWLLDVPALIRARFAPDIPRDRFDPRIKDDESVRAPLQMLCNLLNLWERYRPGELLGIV